MEPTIFRFIFRYSLRPQLLLLAVTAISLPFLYVTLDLPKTIVNEAIGGHDFPKTVLGMELGQVEFLMLLCGAYLVFVLINGAFKYWINVYKGQLGERMLRRLRNQLYGRVLRFPIPHFRRVSQGELIAMIISEVEPLGGFIGDALALPAFQGGTLLTILVFMFVQDPILGTAAVALYPLQLFLIPKLQRKVNDLAKKRVRTVRKLSERVGETVLGVQEVHAHDTSNRELADFSARTGRIYDIRFRIYRLKFLIKFLNNFLASVTPFFFFSIGGYLVIKGDLTFGALVAVLAAYKDLSAPWKELLTYYQTKEDTRVKYEQLIEQFEPAGLLDDEIFADPPEEMPRFDGTLVASNLVLEEDGGLKVIDGASLSLPLSHSTALVGIGDGGRSGLAQILARIVFPTSGSIRVGDHQFLRLPEAVTGRRIAYLDQNSYIFAGTIRDNLLYGLRHRSVTERELADDVRQIREAFIAEAEAAGTSTFDLEAEWIDYEALGLEGADALGSRIVQLLETVDLAEDIYRAGLLSRVGTGAHTDLATKILDARTRFHERLSQADLQDLVEPFDAETYNTNMSVAENVLFGAPVGDVFNLDRLADHPYVHATLEKVGLAETFLETGLQLAQIMVDLFQDLPPDHEYFERFSFIEAEDIPVFRHVIRHAQSAGVGGVEAAEQRLLMSLPFKLTIARHRLGLITPEIRSQILQARQVFARDLPSELASAVAFFDRATVNPAASIQDNILFGKPVYGSSLAQQRINRQIDDIVDSMDVRRDIIEIGLGTQAGYAGSRLTAAQRQKIGLVRCLLKKPDLFVINMTLSGISTTAQEAVMRNLFAEMDGRGVLWVLNSTEMARLFDRIVVMEGGRVVEQGKRADLETSESVFSRLVKAD